MTDFPNCRAAGLCVHKEAGFTDVRGNKIETVYYVYAAEVERLLADAPVVTGREHKQNPPLAIDLWCTREQAGSNEPGYMPPTHTAKLLCIQPIVRDTAESLLREMISAARFGHRGDLDVIATRADQYLDKP